MKRFLMLLATLLFSAFAFAAVNINTATVQELEALDGVGPVKAQAIVDYRKANGRFKSIEQIKEVSGIGDATFEKIKGDISLTGATKLPAGAAKAEAPKAAAPAAAKAEAPKAAAPAAAPASMKAEPAKAATPAPAAPVKAEPAKAATTKAEAATAKDRADTAKDKAAADKMAKDKAAADKATADKAKK